MNRLRIWTESHHILGTPIFVGAIPFFVFQLLFPEDRSHMVYKSPPKFNILEVLEHYGGRPTGADKGGWRKATCPIHEDRNPSASINEDEGKFTCFTCDFRGDALDLIMRMEDIAGFSSALSFATEHFGDGDSTVRAESGGSSLVPQRKGNRPGRRNWQPPWSGF